MQNLQVVILMGSKNGTWEIVDVFCNEKNASKFAQEYRMAAIKHIQRYQKCDDISRKMLSAAGISPVDEVGTNILNPEYWRRRDELMKILWQEFYNEEYKHNPYPIDEFKMIEKTVK